MRRDAFLPQPETKAQPLHKSIGDAALVASDVSQLPSSKCYLTAGRTALSMKVPQKVVRRIMNDFGVAVKVKIEANIEVPGANRGQWFRNLGIAIFKGNGW